MNKYIKLLEAECEEYASFMHARNPGWKSSRFDDGKTIRAALEILNEKASTVINIMSK